MRFDQIGHQLRTFRMESGLRAEEIAARLGVSRAALYRYEKGEVIKLDTVSRLAELLKISPLSLLGIGVEYYTRPIAFFERLRQVEEPADQILQVSGALCFLTTTGAFEVVVAAAIDEVCTHAGAEGRMLRAQSEQAMGLLAARKRSYGLRRPSITAAIPVAAVRRLLAEGLCAGLPISDRTAERCREAARAELEHLAETMESEPIGHQVGLLPQGEPTVGFAIMRTRDRATLATNGFREDGNPAAQIGVATITSADEAVTAHQRVAEACWRETLKGAEGAARLRELVAASREQRGERG
jgi:transcriptional regulator with XRE-family HTH domain